MSRPGRPHLQGRDRGRSGRRGDRRRHGGGVGVGGGVGGGEAAAGPAPTWVRTDSPCSNCTRAVTSMSPSSVGLSVRRISLDVPGSSVSSSQTICGSRAVGSGDAHEGRGGGDGRANADVMGGGPRRVLDEDAVIDFLPGGDVGRGRTWSDTTGVGGSAGSASGAVRPGASGGRPTSGGSGDSANGFADTDADGAPAKTISIPSAQDRLPRIRSPSRVSDRPLRPANSRSGPRLSRFRPALSARFSPFRQSETLRQAAPPAFPLP